MPHALAVSDHRHPEHHKHCDSGCWPAGKQTDLTINGFTPDELYRPAESQPSNAIVNQRLNAVIREMRARGVEAQIMLGQDSRGEKSERPHLVVRVDAIQQDIIRPQIDAILSQMNMVPVDGHDPLSTVEERDWLRIAAEKWGIRKVWDKMGHSKWERAPGNSRK